MKNNPYIVNNVYTTKFMAGSFNCSRSTVLRAAHKLGVAIKPGVRTLFTVEEVMAVGTQLGSTAYRREKLRQRRKEKLEKIRADKLALIEKNLRKVEAAKDIYIKSYGIAKEQRRMTGTCDHVALEAMRAEARQLQLEVVNSCLEPSHDVTYEIDGEQGECLCMSDTDYLIMQHLNRPHSVPFDDEPSDDEPSDDEPSDGVLFEPELLQLAEVI